MTMQDFYNAIQDLADGRVYALIAAQDAAYPVLVYTPIECAHLISLDGPSPVTRARVQVDAYASTLQQCEQLQQQVLSAVLNDIDAVVDVRMGLAGFDEDARVYRVSVDFTYYR
jgi:hypothetical protein